MKKIFIAAATTSMLIYLLSSCYRNKEDILALPKVSFRSDVVPIMTSGACGCHNNGIGTRAVQFSHFDTIFYDAILARTGLFNSWVNGGTHPGAGVIDFKPNEKDLIRTWINQGAQDDGGGCVVPNTVTYNTNILPLYNTSCKGSACHGGLGSNLTYAKMVEKKSTLSSMMASGGVTGHPGGILSLSSCTVKLFEAWIAKGQPQ